MTLKGAALSVRITKASSLKITLATPARLVADGIARARTDRLFFKSYLYPSVSGAASVPPGAVMTLMPASAGGFAAAAAIPVKPKVQIAARSSRRLWLL